MIKDKSMPLYTVTIGEFIELTKLSVHSVLTESSGQMPALGSAPPPHDEHFNISQCAEFLGCSHVSIHNYKKSGLPYYKMGRKILFRKAEVLEFMKTASRRLRNFSKRKINQVL
jgi:excisionase family DNA binding protein